MFLKWSLLVAKRAKGSAMNNPIYKREVAGRIKIVEIFDEHMAKAIILAGEVKPNYFAEMEG
jgi:hypothetical protein